MYKCVNILQSHTHCPVRHHAYYPASKHNCQYASAHNNFYWCVVIQVIVVTHVGVMYLICINRGRGRIAPESKVNTDQIHQLLRVLQLICIHIEWAYQRNLWEALCYLLIVLNLHKTLSGNIL